MSSKISTIMAKGQIFIVVLILITAAAALNVVLFSYVSDEIGTVGREIKTDKAINLAEAGLNKALYELNKNSNWLTSGEIFLGEGSFEATATSSSALSSQKIIESTAYIPNKSNAISAKKIRAIVYISGEYSGFRYAAQSGNGGFEMESNSTVNGNVYTNGNIVCKGNDNITGDGYAFGTITQPVSECGLTAERAHENATSTPLPDFDSNFWQTEAEKGGTESGPQKLTGGSYGPKRINGNLTIDGDVTITGCLYVTGDFEMKSNTSITLSSDFGSNGTTILIDGSALLNSNADVISTASMPKGYIQIINSNSTAGISIDSNVDGGVFYSLNNDIIIKGGGASKKSVKPASLSAGRKIKMESNSELTYDTGFQSQYFTSGSGAGWAVKKGTWRVIK